MAVANYQVTDGGELDMDGTVNGLIEDPAGIAKEVSSANSLASTGSSIGGILIVSLNLIGLGAFTIVRNTNSKLS